MAPGAAQPPDDVQRTADTRLGLHVGRSKTKPAQLCQCRALGAPAVMLRVREDGASLSTSVCPHPILRVVSGACR